MLMHREIQRFRLHMIKEQSMPRRQVLAHTDKSTVVRDSQAILLEGKAIPSKDFIHLYDTTPYILMNGHLAVKLPCDANSVSPLKILIGQAPNLKAA